MKLAVIGAGGHTRSIINLLRQCFDEKDIGIYDDNIISEDEIICGCRVFGGVASMPKELPIVISIGSNNLRESYYDKYYSRIYAKNLLHLKSYIETKCEMGLANQVFANTYINSKTKIGDNNIINTSAVLEHEVEIGSHNHISVNAVVCGRVRMGSRCFIGASATIIDNIQICDDVVIGAGSVVVNNIDRSGVYVGVPARKIK